MCVSYLVHVLLLCLTFRQALLEPCVASNGEIGECVCIHLCPSLIWSYENPRKGYEKHLLKLVCPTNTTDDFFVCCRRESNALVFENNNNGAVIDKNDPTTNSDNCGLQYYTDNLTNQGNITLQEFPWSVAIVKNTYQRYDFPTVISSGSLINARYVLTDLTGTFGIEKNIFYYVRIGEYDVSSASCLNATAVHDIQKCAQYKDYNIREWIIHPFYNPTTGWNNIVLLKLATLVSLKDYNRPICLPTITSQNPKQGDILYVTSWNKTIGNNSTDIKWSFQKKVRIFLIPNMYCKRAFTTLLMYNDNSMCATKTEGEAGITCDDIFGSQIINFDGIRWNLEGIPNNCVEDGNIIAFTKINNYVPWIREHMGNEQCETPNGEQGECVYITDCPVLMKAFANARQEDVKYLRSFICGPKDFEEIEFKKQRFPPVVCCSNSLNRVLHKRQTEKLIKDPDEETNKPLKEYCGLQNRDGYFLRSNVTTTDEFPWVAAIYRLNPANFSNIERGVKYSGVLITSRYVITGAHTLKEFTFHYMVVRLGEYKVRNTKDCLYFQEFESEDCSKVVDYGVERHVAHPFFNSVNHFHDIALLRLNRTVVFSDYVRPICLPNSDLNFAKAEILYATGWGYINTSDTSEGSTKKKIASEYITNEECRERYSVLDTKFISTHHICCAYESSDSQVICIGDNGGPLMVSFKRKWYLVGVLAVYNDELSQPQIYTRLTKYLDWIYYTMEKMRIESKTEHNTL